MTRDHAEAVADGLGRAAGAGRDGLVTRADLAKTAAELRGEIARLESRLTWKAVGLVLGAAGIHAALTWAIVRAVAS